MVEPQIRLGSYLHLARENGANSTPGQQDKLMILGAVCAEEMNLSQVANFCRAKLISKNAGHLLSHYDSVQHALQQEDFQKYLQQIQREFPWEKVEYMVESAGINVSEEQGKFSSEVEYAASLLDATVDELSQKQQAEDQQAEDEEDSGPISDQDVLGAAEESIFGEADDDALEGFDINDIISQEEEHMTGFSSSAENTTDVFPTGGAADSPAQPKQTRSVKPGDVPHLLADDELSDDIQPSSGMSSMSISVTDLGDILPEGAERPDFKKDYRLDDPPPEEAEPSSSKSDEDETPVLEKAESASKETEQSAAPTKNQSNAESKTSKPGDAKSNSKSPEESMQLGQKIILGILFFGVAMLIFGTVLSLLNTLFISR